MTDPTMTEAEIVKVRLASKIITAMNAMDQDWARLRVLADFAADTEATEPAIIDPGAQLNVGIFAAFREAASLGLCVHCGWGADGRSWCRIRESNK